MRRTSFLVLVLAVLFVPTAKASLALPEPADSPAAKAATGKGAVHGHGKTTQHRSEHRSAHTARHASALSRGCPAVHGAEGGSGYPAAHKRLAAAGTSGTRRAQRVVARPSASPRIMSEAGKTRTGETIVAEDTAPPPDSARAVVAQPASLIGKRAEMPPPMRGSLTSLERQNERAEAEGLERIEDEDDLSDRIARRFLVPVPVSAALTVNRDLPAHHRYCRPWTARFLTDLARAHAVQFHSSLEVSSAVRTVEYQKRLMAVNGNAAAAEGDVVSPHLTGATIDIAKSGMSHQEIGWMRAWLMPLQKAGTIDVEEEFQQACFHISVYRNYVPARAPGSIARAGSGRSGMGRGGAGRSGRTSAGRQRPPASRSRPGNVEPDNADTTGGTPALGR
jgi:hypothetical protein